MDISLCRLILFFSGRGLSFVSIKPYWFVVLSPGSRDLGPLIGRASFSLPLPLLFGSLVESCKGSADCDIRVRVRWFRIEVDRSGYATLVRCLESLLVVWCELLVYVFLMLRWSAIKLVRSDCRASEHQISSNRIRLSLIIISQLWSNSVAVKTMTGECQYYNRWCKRVEVVSVLCSNVSRLG